MITLEKLKYRVLEMIKDYECINGIYENDYEYIFNITMLPKYHLPDSFGGCSIVINKTNGKYCCDSYFSLFMQDRISKKIA